MPHHDVEAQEAIQFARYLLDRDPPSELVERYVSADARLFSDPPSPTDDALMSFVRQHPASLPYLDAAAGLLRPGSLLRRKLLLMAAILEASPVYAPEFLASPPGPVRTFLIIAGHGIAAGGKFVLGSALLVMIRPRS